MQIKQSNATTQHKKRCCISTGIFCRPVGLLWVKFPVSSCWNVKKVYKCLSAFLFSLCCCVGSLRSLQTAGSLLLSALLSPDHHHSAPDSLLWVPLCIYKTHWPMGTGYWKKEIMCWYIYKTINWYFEYFQIIYNNLQSWVYLYTAPACTWHLTTLVCVEPTAQWCLRYCLSSPAKS